MDHNKVPIIPKQTVNSIFEPVAKNHYKASNYCTLRHMGLKVAKMKKINFFTNCKPGLLQVLRQEQSHQFFRCGCCGCCKIGNIPPMLLRGGFRIINLWRLAHASALTSSTFSSSSAVSSPINSPTYDFFISFLSDPCSISIAWPCE